jgi:hypothetical protein
VSLQVDVTLTGTRRSTELFERLESNLRDDKQLLSIVDTLIDAQQDRFAGRGVRWKRLSPSSLRQHAKEGVGPQPLVLTGALRDSLTRKGDPNMRVELRPGNLRFGSRIFYARFHQKGKGVPRRTVVGVPKETRPVLATKLAAFLMDGVE